MSGICGPHRLETATPERIRFHHSANVFKSMATTLGTIEYGTDVTVDIEDAEHFSSYSLSLPLVGEQELRKNGALLRSDRDQGVIISPNENQVLAISGDCRKVQVVITRAAMSESLEGILQRLEAGRAVVGQHHDLDCGLTESPLESPSAPSPGGGRTRWPAKAGSTGAQAWAAPVSGGESTR